MSLTVTITRAVQLPAGRPVTLAALRLLGAPSASIAGSVTTGDIAAGAVTPAVTSPGAYFYGEASYAADLYTLNLNPALTALADGVEVWFLAGNDNGDTSPSLNVNSLGDRKIYKWKERSLVAADIRNGQIIGCRYDDSLDGGTGGWQIISQLGAPPYRYATTAGTASAQTLDFGGSTGYPTFKTQASMTGVPVTFKVGAALDNSGAVSLNVDGLGAVAIVKRGGVPLAGGELATGQIYTVRYDGTYYQLDHDGRPDVEYVGFSGGTANALTIAPNPVYTALNQMVGRRFSFKALASNTGPATLSVNGLTATAIKKFGGAALSANDLVTPQAAEVMYDGTNFLLLSKSAAAESKAWVKFDGTFTTKTVTNAIVGNQVTITGHSISAATTVENAIAAIMYTTGTVPTGLTAGQEYWPFVVNANTVTFHTSPQGAVDGTTGLVTLSGNGTGTNTLAYVGTMSARYNVSGIVPWGAAAAPTAGTSTGVYKILFATAFASAAFVVTGACKHGTSSIAGVVAVQSVDAGVAGSKIIRCEGTDGTAFVSLEIHFMAFGMQ
jgi:hypothetical protein